LPNDNQDIDSRFDLQKDEKIESCAVVGNSAILLGIAVDGFFAFKKKTL
jgi:hypothetical protein